ncbi:MAG: DUF4340 domain-containing protein [Proteobacteria bacterium]|nr:MAG: DUF4340 domain-containing protein [Pseudomonadota bacterium]
MSPKVTFALMLVFIAMGSFAFFDPFDLKANKETRGEQSSHVFWLKDKKLETFAIQNGAENFQFQCLNQDGCAFDGSADWKLIQPVEDLADPTQVGSVAATIKALLIQEKVELEQAPDPAEFGFPETNLAVEFRVKGENEPYKLTIGKAVPVGANVYAITNRAPKTIYLIANTVPLLLKKDLFHWRNKRLFPGTKPDTMNRLSWSTRGVNYRAERTDKGWMLKDPIAAPANSIMLEGLLSTLSYTNAKSVFAIGKEDPAAKKVLQGKPILEASFGIGDNPPASVKVFPQPGAKPSATDFVAQSSALTPLFVVEGNPLERFQKDLLSYRDRRLFPGAELSAANKLELKFPRTSQSITLEKKGPEWVQTAGVPTPEPFSQSRINAFVNSLATAEAQDFVSAPRPEVAAFAKQTPDVELSVGEAGQPAATARFLLSERQFALTAGYSEKEVRRFGADFLKVLPIRLQDLYASSNKQVITEPKGAPDGHDHSHGHSH